MRPHYPLWCIASLVFALWIAFINPLTVENAQISYRDKSTAQDITLPFSDQTKSDYFLIQATLNYHLLNSGILRIISQQCVESMTVNGNTVTELDAISPENRCFPHTLTLDIAPYLAAGKNHLT